MPVLETKLEIFTFVECFWIHSVSKSILSTKQRHSDHWHSIPPAIFLGVRKQHWLVATAVLAVADSQ